MLSFSNPAELKRLSNVLQWAAIALVFLGGVLQLLRFVVDQREKTLSAALAQQKEAAQLQRDKETGERLSQAQNEIARLEAQRQELVGRLQSRGEEIEGVKGSLAQVPTSTFPRMHLACWFWQKRGHLAAGRKEAVVMPNNRCGFISPARTTPEYWTRGESCARESAN